MLSILKQKESTDKEMIIEVINGVAVKYIDDNSKIVVYTDTPTSFAPRLFNNCTYDTTFTIPDTVTKIDNYAFYNSKFKKIIIPYSVRYVGKKNFRNTELVLKDRLNFFEIKRGGGWIDNTVKLSMYGEKVFSICLTLSSLSIILAIPVAILYGIKLLPVFGVLLLLPVYLHTQLRLRKAYRLKKRYKY